MNLPLPAKCPACLADIPPELDLSTGPVRCPRCGTPLQRRRRNRRRPLALLVAITLAMLSAMIWLGPLLSGGLSLAWAPSNPSVVHGLPSDFEPVHKGGVDIATGLYIREDDDFVLAGDFPFIFRRTYRTRDRQSRHFGIGASHPGEWYLIGDPVRFSWAELIREDGGRVHFDRTSPGRYFMNAVYVHLSTNSEFYQSRLAWTGLDWVLRYEDGRRARFQSCGGIGDHAYCSLRRLEDADDHAVVFERDRAGVLRRIRGERQSITLQYDDQNRVAVASDDIDNRVVYSYDAGGRLTRVASSDGTTRSYEYGPHDELLKVTDPGRIVVNTYDDLDRVIKQITYRVNPVSERRSERSALIQFAYRTISESVTETDTTEYDGTHTVTRFDHQRPVMEVLDAAGPTPIHVAYNLEQTEHTKSVTVSCVVRGVSRQRTVAAENYGVEGTRDAMVRDMCER